MARIGRSAAEATVTGSLPRATATAALSPASGRIALAILRKEAEPGSTVTVDAAAGPVEAEVVELPFIEGYPT